MAEGNGKSAGHSQARAGAAAFPIVGIGASAGGLDPIRELLGNAGDTPAAAFLVVLHQSAHDGSLVEVLARSTALPVVEAEDGAVVEMDRVYVIPAATVASLTGRQLSLRPASHEERAAVLDALFHSLANEQGPRAMAVVLSGSGNDGAAGTTAVKSVGGATFAQDVTTAEFPQMPRAAISRGVDFVLRPDEIAREIVRIAQKDRSDRPSVFREGDLREVLDLLHTAHDVDFTHYKPATLERRFRRRMAMHRVRTVRDYVDILRGSREELERLYADMLIQVTAFFRDPDVFSVLEREVLLPLMRDRTVEPVRIWVPGCATGEEAYSLAMMFLETAPADQDPVAVQVFGTDISDAAIAQARGGLYPDSAVEGLTPERLSRFFTKTDRGYRVTRTLRECCVFARHDLTRDPPFSQVDLISCRNVLIYLGAPLQRRVMSVFHYALRPDGYLLLGISETIGGHGELFRVAERRARLYRRKPSVLRLSDHLRPPSAPAVRVEKVRMEDEATEPGHVFREADRVLLARFTPPGVLIDENMDVLQFRGRTGLFLEPPTGAASFNLLRMAREGLVADLRAAIQAAGKQEAAVRREGVRVGTDGHSISVNLEVVPFAAQNHDRYFLVLFEQESTLETDAPSGKGQAKKKTPPIPEKETRYTTRLKRELEATREYLQAIIEEQETMNEELRSANEEIQSSNEELQSTNEELETAKEELQSSNEELMTLNEELENRHHETSQVNEDLQNVMAAVDWPVVILDAHLRIRRFNPEAQRALHLIAADVGRPVSVLETTLVLEDLEGIVRGVTESLEPREQPVADRRGHSYSLRLHPYRTSENRVEGAVLMLV